MKSPNPSNIDQWLFHYFEGDLSHSDEMHLEEFLLEHPEFDDQFEAWGAARMNPVQLEYANRGALLKPWVTPIVLNRVAVVTAIGINAVLASFILFNSGIPSSESAFSALQLNALDFKSDKSTTLSSSQMIVHEGDPNSSSIGLSSTTRNTVNLDLSNSSLLDDNSNSSATLISFSTTPMLAELSGNQVLINSNSHSNQDVQEFAPIETTEDLSSNNLHVSTPDTDITNVTLSYHIETVTAPQSTESSPQGEIDRQSQEGSNASDNHNPKIKTENNSRDKKPFRFSNRFKGGDLLLTNSRDLEYLVPGMTRNQLNFGHVASDFSNVIYSNSYLQWPGHSSAMISNQLGYDFYLPEAKSGVGFQMIYDRYANGAINNIEFSATYSPKFFLSKDVVFEPAVRFKMGGTGVDRNRLAPGTWVEYDRENAFLYTNAQQNAQVNRSIHQDFGLGFLLNTKWGFVGANADNLIGAKNHALYYGSSNYDDRNPVFFNAMVGTEYESVDKKLRWSGQVVYQNYGNLNKFWFGSRIKYNYLSLGASVSSAGEPMLSFGMMARNFSLLYSTDYSYSQLSQRKHLSHQLTMRVTLKESRMRKLMLN